MIRKRTLRLEQLETRELFAGVFQNTVEPNDVNGDTFVSPQDALVVINKLNSDGSLALPGPREEGTPYYDVNGDSFVSPNDVLQVINSLNGIGDSAPIDSRSDGAGDGLKVPGSTPIAPLSLKDITLWACPTDRKVTTTPALFDGLHLGHRCVA